MVGRCAIRLSSSPAERVAPSRGAITVYRLRGEPTCEHSHWVHKVRLESGLQPWRVDRATWCRPSAAGDTQPCRGTGLFEGEITVGALRGLLRRADW